MSSKLRMALMNAKDSAQRMAIMDSFRESLADVELENTFQGTGYSYSVCTDCEWEEKCGG